MAFIRVLGRAADIRGGLAALIGALLFIAAPTAMAQAAIYWWQSPGPTIGRVNLDGTNLDPALISVPASVPSPRVFPPGGFITSCGGVAVSDSHVYWGDPERGAIGRAHLNGSSPEYLFVSGVGNACGVAVDSSHVYWADLDGEILGRARLDGTGSQALVSKGLELRPCGVAVDRTHLFWGSDNSDWLGRANLDGSDAAPRFLEDAGGGCGVALDGSHVYWSDLETSIGRAKLDGSDPERKFVTGLDHPCGVALHGGHVYWAEQTGEIGRASIDGTGGSWSISTESRDVCGIGVEGSWFASDPLPSSDFSFGPVKHGRGGVAFLALDLPGSGAIAVESSGVGWRIRNQIPFSGTIGSAGRVWLKLRPRGSTAAARRLRRAISLRGKVQIAIEVAFTARGLDLDPIGSTTRKGKRLNLLARSGRRTGDRPPRHRLPGR